MSPSDRMTGDKLSLSTSTPVWTRQSRSQCWDVTLQKVINYSN